LPGPRLRGRLPVHAETFLELRDKDDALARAPDPNLRGLACALASEHDAGRFLARRPRLLERIASAGPGALAARADELARHLETPAGDLELALDALRLVRREETLFAACLDLGGIASFEEVSVFLSRLAEAIVERALALARPKGAPPPALAILGMGKIAGREFTFHSDLDLIFLYEGGAEAVTAASRLAQRAIAYLTTATGAGVAYAVDTRLRPSGSQGALVTSFDAFVAYQTEQAQTWEHLALMRARAAWGEAGRAREALARARAEILARRTPAWSTVAEMKQRIESERARETPQRVAFKCGAGGLMDAEFLATGGILERGAEVGFPALPNVPALLRAACPGAAAEALLADYGSLRRLEARARFVSGRNVELLERDGEALSLVAELLHGEDGVEPLLAEIAQTRRRVRAAFLRVLEAGRIGGIDAP
jgi:glutamate-ammonia-ligase adenylyltransferase